LTEPMLNPNPKPAGRAGRGRTAAEAVRGRVEAALDALGGLLAAVPLPAHVLGPLLRAAAQALTVEGLPVLQVKAVGALRARPA